MDEKNGGRDTEQNEHRAPHILRHWLNIHRCVRVARIIQTRGNLPPAVFLP